MDDETVLVVEDEAVVAEFLRSKLESLDYEVLDEMRRGQEAITFCDNHDVDIVLMDIKLEGELDGIEAARQIKQRNEECIIVYVTAYSGPELLERAKNTEPAGYLIKPIDEEELVCTLEIAIHNRSLRRQRREALNERNKALEEKEALLGEIKTVVEQNSNVLSELLQLTRDEVESADRQKQGLKALKAMVEMSDQLEDVVESDGESSVSEESSSP